MAIHAGKIDIWTWPWPAKEPKSLPKLPALHPDRKLSAWWAEAFFVLSPILLKACGRSLQTPPVYYNEGRGLRLDAPAKIKQIREEMKKKKPTSG